VQKSLQLRWAAAGFVTVMMLLVGKTADADSWTLHTPALLATRGWCSVTNLSYRTRTVTIKILDQNGAVLQPINDPLQLTVALDPGHTALLEGFREQDESGPMRCVAKVWNGYGWRHMWEVSLCNQDDPLVGATACVQAR
jgi:hypothetical protein